MDRAGCLHRPCPDDLIRNLPLVVLVICLRLSSIVSSSSLPIGISRPRNRRFDGRPQISVFSGDSRHADKKGLVDFSSGYSLNFLYALYTLTEKFRNNSSGKLPRDPVPFPFLFSPHPPCTTLHKGHRHLSGRSQREFFPFV